MLTYYREGPCSRVSRVTICTQFLCVLSLGITFKYVTIYKVLPIHHS